jgi:hypothetical protein
MQWPNASQLARDPDRFTLVLAAHPRCPCTRASMEGLAQVVAGADTRLTTYVLMMTPGDSEQGWEKTDVWDGAQRIPGVKVVSDRDGAEAQLFGARTSGQTLLYDPHGTLVFRGGLTPARGHPGATLGQKSILALIHGGVADATVTEVFGCALADTAHHQN